MEVIRSRDAGTSWAWLNQPSAASKRGITDAAGAMVDGRIYVVWRGHTYPAGAGHANQAWVCCSEDGGDSWDNPVQVDALSTERGSFELQILPMPRKGLTIVQDIRDDYAAGSGEVWLATSWDGGRTWTDKAVYSAGGLCDPAIAVAPDGTLLLAGNSRTGSDARPWIVHGRIEK